MTVTSWNRSAASWLVIATIAFGALAFGATEHWARGILRLLAFACLCLAWWSEPHGDRLPRAARALLVPAALLFAVAIVQLIPLPRAVLSAISPMTVELYERTVPPPGRDLTDWLAERAGDHGITVDPEQPAPELPVVERPASTGRTLSVAPHATRSAIGSWLTAVVLFLASASLARNPFLRYRLIWGLTLLCGALGAIGVAQRISWNGLLFWFRARPPGSTPIGPFVNPNHYAGFLEMTALVAIGLALALIVKRGRGVGLSAIRAALVEDQWTLPRLVLAVSCSILGVAGLLIADSRGGLLAFGAGLAFVLLVRRSRVLVVVLIVSIVMVGMAAGLVTWIGHEDAEIDGVPFALSSSDPSGALRVSVWGSTLRMFLDHPVAGTGLGTFRWAFPAYQRAGEWQEWRQAHNDFVQFLGETGAIGAIVLLWGLVALLRRSVLPVVAAARGGAQWTSIACAAAVFAMLVHTIVDFNLQIPSNAALFAVILGILAAGADDVTHVATHLDADTEGVR